MDGGNTAPNGDRQFDNAPIWYFNDGQRNFNNNWIDNRNPNYGSGSFVLPVYHFPNPASREGRGLA